MMRLLTIVLSYFRCLFGYLKNKLSSLKMEPSNGTSDPYSGHLKQVKFPKKKEPSKKPKVPPSSFKQSSSPGLGDPGTVSLGSAKSALNGATGALAAHFDMQVRKRGSKRARQRREGKEERRERKKRERERERERERDREREREREERGRKRDIVKPQYPQ